MARELRRRLARVPLAMPVVAAGAAVAVADGSGAWWVVLVLAVVAAVWSDRWRGLALALTAAVLAGLCHGQRLRADRGSLARLFAEGDTLSVRLRAEVTTVPVIRGSRWTAMVRVIDGEGHGAAALPGMRVWWSGAGQVPLAGAVVEAQGVLGRPPVPRNPGEFDFAGWLWRQRVGAVFEPLPGRPGTVLDPAGLRGRLEHWRGGFADAVTLGLDPASRQARVIRAMVVGETPAGDDELIGAFRDSGALHVFSVSGLHVGMVAMIGWVLLSQLRVPRRWAVFLLLGGVFCYAWLAGWKAPALRSAWMAAVVLTGFLLRRPAALLQALSVVALVAVALDGHQLFLPGFQLSYGVVAAIGMFGMTAGAWFRHRAGLDPFLPRSLLTRWQERRLKLRESVLSSFGVSLAAWVGSAPLIGWHFGLLTPVAPFASLVLMPVVFVILALGLAGAALAPVVPGLAAQVNRINGLAADVSVWLAAGAAEIPGACVPLAAMVPAPEKMVVYDLPYGGAAAVWQAGGRGAVLLDTGDAAAFERVVLPALRGGGSRVSDLVLTHPDAGHIGGAPVALDALRPRRVWLPVERARSPSYRSLLAAAPADGRHIAWLGQTGRVDQGPAAVWEVIHAADPVAWDAVADDRCAVLRLHWHGWRILCTADAGFLTERRLLERGTDVAADVWITGHHRTDPGFTVDFLAAVGPRLVVASHAPFPPEERLPDDWPERLERAGIAWFHQGESGAVTIQAGPGRLRATGFVDGKRVELLQDSARVTNKGSGGGGAVPGGF